MLVLIAALAAAELRSAPSVDAEALRSGKGVLVLQCGSDWCVSGESVREAFESPAFARTKAGQQYVRAVYDDMDNPTDAVTAKNQLISPILIRTKRFPAITCYALVDNELRVFAQIENVPYNVTPEKLGKAIAKVTAVKDKAVALFKKAASAKTPEEAADMYGQGFDMIAQLMGPFHFEELKSGKCGWRKEWDELVKLDAGDRYGWLAHFYLDEYKTVANVEAVTNAKTDGARGKAEQLVAAAKALPQKHMTPNQKQYVYIMEYALSQNGTDKPLTTQEKVLMQRVFELGRDTIWGQFAMGRLIMDGEKIESKGLKHAAVRPRPTNAIGGIKQDFPLEHAKSQISSIKPGAKLDEKQKTAIARYAALRLIGEKGWQVLVSRPGSGPFVKAFLNDREWLEDFAWSGSFPENSSDGWANAGTGPGDGARAILALESLIFQDNGKWVEFADGQFENNEGRRFMTALAQVFPDKDEEWLADVLDAYRTSALTERLHKSAYTQPVWLWRFAVQQGHGAASCDNMAAQQRHLDKFVNLPIREYGGTPWMIAYRLKNCFGDSVHGPWYYKPWATAGEWPKRKYSQIVGGVCGELSKFGSAIANAHGLPSTTVGQPGHCAYSRRLLDGSWEIDYSVTGHSQMHMCFWNKHEWQYTPALEGTYSGDRETRLGAERMISLAHLAEENGKDRKVIENFHQHACAAKPDHFGAWYEYGEWLMRSNTPLDQIRVWVRGCARGMKAGRQPLWNILTPYFERVAKEKGLPALKEDLIAFAPLLKQGGTKIQEEADFGTVLTTWGDLLGGDKQARYDVLKAMLEAQYGTPDYFSQTMGWGSDYFTKTAEGSKIFTKCLNEAIAAKSKGAGAGDGASMNFGPMILAASKNGNIEAFRNIVNLQAKLAPLPKVDGQAYSAKDFGGDLVSKDGLLKTSSTCNHDDPARYPLAIDDSPCAGRGAFHTDGEEAPWAIVMLAGPTEVKGLVIENRFGGYNATRQVPLVVEVSEDGSEWRKVYETEAAQDTYRVDLRGVANRTRQVRVSRKAGAKKEVYHLNKILVYGTKLY
jgi:hypothetical protein